jgi:diguanylate cyclase (GGDEF)-like protein
LRGSIRARLSVGFALGLLPVVLVMVGAFLAVGFATSAINEAVAETSDELIPVTEQYRAALRAQRELHAFALQETYDPEAYRRFSAEIDATFEALGEITFAEVAEVEMLQAANAEWIAVKAIGEELFEMAPAAVDERVELLRNFDARAAEFLGTLQDLQDFIVAELVAQLDQLEQISRRALIGVAAVSVLAVVLLGLVIIWALRSNIGPVRSLREAADRFGDGDLSQRVELTYPDEIGLLGSTFNPMANQLETNLIELEELSVRDDLTGLFNRREFSRRLYEEELPRARRYERPVSLLILDLDNLKIVNDEYGHPAGDEVLRFVARSIADRVRPVDSVARYGGDEFVVMAPETDAPEAVAMAERIRDTVAAGPARLPFG